MCGAFSSKKILFVAESLLRKTQQYNITYLSFLIRINTLTSHIFTEIKLNFNAFKATSCPCIKMYHTCLNRHCICFYLVQVTE